MTTRDALKRLMRYNDWHHDPYSIDPSTHNRSAELAIAARYDLNQNKPLAFGNTDAKLVSSADVAALRLDAVCGPSHDTQPVFAWTGPWKDEPFHMGHPERFDFDWHLFEF